MLCSRCKKREATVHIVRMSDNKKSQMDLCPVCAEQYYKRMKDKMVFSQDGSTLLKAILANPQDFGIMFNGGVDDKRCPVCGTSGKMIRKTGLAGCPECYHVFEAELQPIIDKVQKANEHCGYVPKGMLATLEKKKTLQDLQQEISELIEKEQYEEAAVVRDKIRALEDNHVDPV
ncbi:UvrB/UvrC motif-containing protein [Clostridia bacterium]|nr:UvrB/UvrC motif-containing protein [Clostridia bacterium]